MPAITRQLLLTTNLGPTLGATYVGAMVMGIFYGSTCIQTFLYLKNYSQDWTFQKCAVILLWILDSLHTVFTIVVFWHYLIDSFGNYVAILYITWEFKLQLLIGVVGVLVVQSLYTLRIWRFTANRAQRIWSWTLILVLMVGYAAGITFLVQLYSISWFFDQGQIRWSIYFGLAMTTFNDFMLAAAICHLLSLHKTTFAETKSKIWIIMFYAVISGTLTSICSLASLITYAVMPNNFIYQAIEFLLPKPTLLC
ncbi:hypothetical protein F5887DRAFT_51181 [Amanita rubescens]|nr:hypothetical protein F5887DRAFT_51181 [Amanita rubescens]